MARASSDGDAAVPMLTESPQPNLGAEDATALHLRFWTLTVVTGVLAGVAAGLLMLLLRAVQRAAWGKTAAETFLDVVQAARPATCVAVLTGAGVLVAAGRWLLQRTTGGHGAELTEALWFGTGAMPVRRTLFQALLSMVLVGLGASLGRESAPKQMGAVFGSTLARWAALSPSHCRLLAAFGAGAGMAAVYNVPFGGALFALEVLLGTLTLPLVPPAVVASGVATATAWLLLPQEPSYEVASFAASPALIVGALLLGPVAGGVAVTFIRMIAWADARRPIGPWRLVLSPIGVFVALGGVAVVLPQLLGNGKDVVQLALAGQVTVPLLVALLVLKPVATAACLGSGAPGGLFTPTLTVGAVLGGLFGAGWAMFWPGTPAGAYALVGAAAVLAAASQGPVSAVVLMVELTRRLDSAMVPVLLAVGGAVLTGRLLDARSIYSGRIHSGHRQADEQAWVGPRVSAAARYAALLQVLLRSGGEPVRVVDQHGAVLGPVARARAAHPSLADGPLETATAGDFVERAPSTPAASGWTGLGAWDTTDAQSPKRADPPGEGA